MGDFYARDLRRWVEARCVLDGSGRIGVTIAHREYCREMGFPPWPNPQGIGISRNRFSREVRRVMGGRVGLVRSGVMYFGGIRWRAPGDSESKNLASGGVI